MSTADVAKFFSVPVFEEARMATTPARVYVELFGRFRFPSDLALVAANRPAIELFVECMELSLCLLVLVHPALGPQTLVCAQWYLNLGRFGKARLCGERALQATPGDSAAKALVMKARQAERTCQRVRKACAVAGLPLVAARPLVAELDVVLAFSPASPEALVLRATALVAAKAYGEAVVFFQRLPRPLVVSDATLAAICAHALSYSGRLDAAVALLQDVPPTSHTQRSHGALACLRCMHARRAGRCLMMGVKPVEGTRLAQGGNFEVAVAVLTSCLALDVNNALYRASVLFERGGAYLGVDGKENEAITDLDECLRLQPDHAMAPLRLHKARVQLATSDMHRDGSVRRHNPSTASSAKNPAHRRRRPRTLAFKSHGAMRPSNDIFREAPVVPREQLCRLMAKPPPSTEPSVRPSRFGTAPLPDYYAVLGVATTASQKAIVAAYQRLASQLHPAKDAASAERRQSVAVAYAVLGDASARREYDGVAQSPFYAEK
ncbi:hypothetical protein ACHHYP_00737 [Achlya hypogyna]|uniref:J domain-containing protein n=1 Tax=Achlya hypogyna TaxID=1202772 RepID=A0A1V9ZTY1_ACHHY|nr:hypothetical protein ACHHYP_00737 [Achlya hypogyna]